MLRPCLIENPFGVTENEGFGSLFFPIGWQSRARARSLPLPILSGNEFPSMPNDRRHIHPFDSSPLDRSLHTNRTIHCNASPYIMGSHAATDDGAAHHAQSYFTQERSEFHQSRVHHNPRGSRPQSSARSQSDLRDAELRVAQPFMY